MQSGGFIERHELWSDEQRRQAEELRHRLQGMHLVRVVWVDSHGASRAKALSVAAFLGMLKEGHNINVATSTLDASGGRVFSSFVRGGGMDLDEMTGSPNLVIVPDVETFRELPWAPGVGWVLCDEYFRDGRPFHFSSRNVLRKQMKRLGDFKYVIGLEVEWYLAELLQQELTSENTGVPGRRGHPVKTAPVEPGYSYHSETNLDLMQPVFDELTRGWQSLGLELRSLENEYGPGQVEATFSAQDALGAADDYVLFRTATRQICRRLGYFATFMCRPALPGHFSSGWHLHQSLTSARTGENLFTPNEPGRVLSEKGETFLAGLLHHALPATVFATPTINGYRRFRPNSLAPDRVAWGIDHRGTMIRVISALADPSTRLENRVGEPAANPYLFVASQIAAGLDGLERGLELPPPEDAPYQADVPRLPTSLEEALQLLSHSDLFRKQFGGLFIDYYLRLKEAELDRFRAHCSEAEVEGEEVTLWEQNEYYDFF